MSTVEDYLEDWMSCCTFGPSYFVQPSKKGIHYNAKQQMITSVATYALKRYSKTFERGTLEGFHTSLPMIFMHQIDFLDS